MKENILDVLMYLIERYIDTDTDSNREILENQLLAAGFNQVLIEKAFNWLEALGECQDGGLRNPAPRFYTMEEQERMDVEARGFLLFLEQNGIVDGWLRELIIDRVMALEIETVDLEKIKWVVLMVLFNQPGHETSYSWLEDMVYNNTPPYLH